MKIPRCHCEERSNQRGLQCTAGRGVLMKNGCTAPKQKTCKFTLAGLV
ncbi:hypothetical protein [Flavobacterium rhamnosiphilum]|nr:hypothetical protein [Flavobacterium rhamnosiphilum]